MNLDFLLPIWNPFIVYPLEAGLRAFATPLQGMFSPGVAGGLAIILFTLALRIVLLPLAIQQIRSQKHQLSVQPELRALQRKFKGDREGMARAQMALYKERGVNPAAGCLPLLIQMPILFGMYSAMAQLATQGLTLDQVQTHQINPGSVVYQAHRTDEPIPSGQFVLASLTVVPSGSGPITLEIPQDQADLSSGGTSVLASTQGLTLTPGQLAGNVNPPSTPGGKATLYLKPIGVRFGNGTSDTRVQEGQPFEVDLEVNAPQERVDTAQATITFDAATASVTDIKTPQLTDVPFKSAFLWLRSLGEPDVFHFPGLGFPIPGLLLLIMTLTSFVSQRMMSIPSDDPQQQAMMQSMAFMPLIYLFFFLGTPAGLVLYWLTSNVFQMFQQYFTIGLGTLGMDIQRYTGRDLQPPWAHNPNAVPATPVPPTSASNGRANGAPRKSTAANSDDTSLAPGARRTTASVRDNRPAPGKGRKRGKR